jgi:hypothetical protein
LKRDCLARGRLKKSKKHHLSYLALLLSTIMACVDIGSAYAQSKLQDFIAAGTPLVNLRLRFEDLDQANKPKVARATTLRARFGYQTATLFGFSLLGEADLVQHLGDKRFNDSINGLAAYPTIADPDLATVNRLQLSYGTHLLSESGPADLTFIAGRQRIIFGDARFIGNADWRQHEQTFDAVTVSDTSLPATTLTYSYVARVNRVFGPHSPVGDYDSHSHLFNAVYGGLFPALKLEGYTYLLDLREAPALSTATYGLRAEGTFDLASGLTAKLNGAYADQTDRANNPLHFDLSYYLGEAGLAYRGITGLVGYEVMQGNGTTAFQTPLASLHAFQGWAETFLTKPPNGLEDFYVKAGYGFAATPIFARVSATLIYHDFAAQHVSADYGNEWDAQLEGQIDSHFVLDMAYADYSGAGPFPDKKVFWLYATYRY